MVPFLLRVFPLPLGTLPIIMSSFSTLHWAIDIKKRVCNGRLFPGNLDPSSLTPGGPVVPLVRGFRRRDNLLAWRELFANLYELKSRIGYGRNKSASSKFKGYLDLTYFRQTSREDFKNNDERKWVGKFWYLKYLSLGVHLHKTSRIFLATPTLDAEIYTTNQTIRKSLRHSCWLMPWD